MTKEELYDLLEEMALPDSIIDMLNAPQWRFWSRGENIRGEEALPLLREFVEQKSGRSDTKIRENAYSVLAKLLAVNMEPEYCQFLIDRLNVETNKNVLQTMLGGISRLRLPASIDISAIVACSNCGEGRVRQNAILALGVSNTDASREAVRYWVRQEDEKQHEFELIYANAALGYIGEPSDIALLERHIHSRIRDVRESAIYAIDHIRQRYGISPALS